MFPDKHLKDLESSEKRSKLLNDSAVAFLFLISFVLIGPLIHEIAHLSLLELKGCKYVFDIGFLFPNGLNAEVKPLCAIKSGYLLLFYSIGYLTTLVIGASLNIAGSWTDRREYSNYFMAAGTGMLLSVTLTIGIEGDIQNALSVMKLDPSYGIWIVLLIVLGVFASSIHGLNNLAGLERQE